MPAATIPHVKPEEFAKIPETGSYVSTSKTRDYMGSIITSLTGYDEIRMARRLGLYPTSSAEWGKSRKYFQDNPDKKFNGKSGKEIEARYISGKLERVATLLAFKENGEFPRDVHDLLKGFDGEIALIDFPYVQEDEDIFIPSPRMRIVDVTGKIPLGNGYVKEYDDDLGVVTVIGQEPNSKYNNTYFWIGPDSKGTRQLIRRHWIWHPHGNGRFDVSALWKSSDSDSTVAARLSSANDPAEFLDPEKTRIMAAKQETLELLEKISEKYGIDPESIVQGMKGKYLALIA